jgi:hypothetical protein
MHSICQNLTSAEATTRLPSAVPNAMKRELSRPGMKKQMALLLADGGTWADTCKINHKIGL